MDGQTECPKVKNNSFYWRITLTTEFKITAKCKSDFFVGDNWLLGRLILAVHWVE
jgi:hypothetical protein